MSDKIKIDNAFIKRSYSNLSNSILDNITYDDGNIILKLDLHNPLIRKRIINDSNFTTNENGQIVFIGILAIGAYHHRTMIMMTKNLSELQEYQIKYHSKILGIKSNNHIVIENEDKMVNTIIKSYLEWYKKHG